jgi:uncharacterized protein
MAILQRTPGLYRERLDPVRAIGPVARGDVPVLLGYTVRGPAAAPVRVDSLQQLEAVFGPPPAHGHLWPAVKGFFETGGRSAYVIRVASASARAAEAVDSPGGTAVAWRSRASFPWTMIDPRRLAGDAPSDTSGWVQVYEQHLEELGRRSPDPGSWGNDLSVTFRRVSRVETTAVRLDPTEGTELRVASLAGLDAHSILELTQTPHEGETQRTTAVPLGVDALRSLVVWPRADDLLPWDLDHPVGLRLSSIEFDVSVLHAGKPEQFFGALSPHPDHARSLVGTMAAQCRDLDIVPEPPGSAPLSAVDWSRPDSWPREGTVELGGGSEGLDDIEATAWLDALRTVARLDDAAMVACPDLVLGAAGPEPADVVAPPLPDCHDLRPAARARLAGVVVDASGSGPTEHPLVDVDVVEVASGAMATTAGDGTFLLEHLDEGLVTLRLRRGNYEPLEFLAQSTPFRSVAPVRIEMARITMPRALGEPEVLTIQQAMGDPVVVGPYKVAFLDPPVPTARPDELLTWRAKLGGNPRLGFFAPWLLLPDPDGGAPVPCPPCGHVCGAFADAERARGIHHSGANRPLRHTEGTTLALDGGVQAELNPAGVNAIRAFPGRGIRIHGTRSLSSDPEWLFLTTRRIVDAVEKTLERALRWMVFEGNDVYTRHAVKSSAETLLDRLHRAGVLSGATPEGSFTVRCDETNNPASTRDAGTLVAEIGVAPSAPYEFVYFRLGHAFDPQQITEEL